MNILETSGEEHRFAPIDEHGIRLAGGNRETPFKTHVYDEGIKPHVIPLDIPVEKQKIRREVRTLHQPRRLIGRKVILHVRMLHRVIIHDFKGEIRVEFARIPVSPRTVIIVNTVSDIRQPQLME